MIVFCEDCGEKNIVGSEQFKEGKWMFRCNACLYLNAYKTKTPEKIDLKKTDLFTKESPNFPEIIGLFLFHTRTGVLKNYRSGFLKKKNMDILGHLLTKTYTACNSHYTDINEMAVVISNKNMIVKMIAPDTFVIIASKTFPLLKDVSDRLDRLIQDTGLQPDRI